MSRRSAGPAALLALAACGPGQEQAAAAGPGSARAGEAAAAAVVPVPASARAAAGPGSATAPRPLFRIVGFRTPRSVLHDPEADVYLVSNVNGDPAAAYDDDNGFISRIAPDGKVLDLKWIDGAADDDVLLSAPMGMALSGGQLWVADRNQVHAFDARTGKHRASYKIKQAN